MTEVRSESQKAGMPPGSIVYVGRNAPSETSIELISYTSSSLEESRRSAAADLLPQIKKGTVNWLNVIGLKNVNTIQNICEKFAIHPLIIEDILNTNQRPKVEFHTDYIYVCLKMLYNTDSAGLVSSEQISLILGKDFVLSFQEVEGDVFNPIRERIRSSGGRVRTQSSDYLLYCLLDAIIDNYFLILENLGESLEDVQDMVLENDSDVIYMLHAIKRDIISIRRFIWPARDLLHAIERSDHSLISKGTVIYLRDVAEHSVRAIETIEMFREMATSAFEIHLSTISNKMNQVMRVLTIISTFFIPLTFIAGIYGMNFTNMPELQYPWAYPALLSFMLVIAICMAIFFKRKKWI